AAPPGPRASTGHTWKPWSARSSAFGSRSSGSTPSSSCRRTARPATAHGWRPHSRQKVMPRPKPRRRGCALTSRMPMKGVDQDADPRETSATRVRYDKWLWAARFYKTRSLAAQAIDAGQARLGGARVKPAHAVRTGDEVSIRRRGIVVEVVVTALSDRRGSATDAARLYQETAASVVAREQEDLARRQAIAAQPRFAGRPTKRERRKLEDFLNEP